MSASQGQAARVTGADVAGTLSFRALGQGSGAARRWLGAHRGAVTAIALSVVSLVAWFSACTQMSVSEYTDLGLYSATTLRFWLALVGGVVALVIAIRASRFSHLAALCAVSVLVAVLYSTPSVVEGTPRVEAVYRHLGLIQHFATTGQLERYLDAYSNWPGFFGILGIVQGATGVQNLLVLAVWAPTIAALSYIAPVLLIARSLNPSPRVAWLAVSIFLAANWSGQDYLAPQTFALWALLSIAGIVMTVLRRKDDASAEGPAGPLIDRLPRVLGRTFGRSANRSWVAAEGTRVRLTSAEWVGVHVLLCVAIIAISAAHQLTPFMLAMTLLLLWAIGRSPHWWLWGLSILVIVFWLAVPALPFIRGNLPSMISGVVDVFTGSGTDDGPTLGSRTASGSVLHQLVVEVRIRETLAVWILAGLGALVMMASRRRAREAILLAGSPLLLIPVSAYGGEILIRAFLFGLPLMAFLAAVFLLWTCAAGGWRNGVLAVVLVALVGTTVLTRYGNERGESFRPSEIGALDWLYAHTAPDATVVQFTQNTPRPIERYADNTWVFLNNGSPGPRWPQQVTPSRLVAYGLATRELGKASRRDQPIYFIYNRAQTELAELSGNTSAAAMQRSVREMDADPRVRTIYRNADAQIWRLRPGVRPVTGLDQAELAGRVGETASAG
ncbi:hypothetical protein GCM10011519_03830 [Marmoricola endophyticus]|uniref:Uncharacterized protein n=1 Tax=Marmoricola endophyticus TaxID=2040280 RepID=A0A917B9Z9_9ACTN|nr:hypothetical protein [Marmoricola endophyticus]GGF33633.1 hypothetical protein GCM10011519_03830 [Marmoricola endophyticus]